MPSTVKNPDLLIASCKLWLCPAKQVSDEVRLTAYVNVPFMGAAAQSLIQGSAVPLLFTGIHLANQDVIRP